jgi:putative transposase
MVQALRRSRQEWERIVKDQASSGLSARKYCDQKSIGLASFYEWRRRLSTGESLLIDGKEGKSFIDIGQLGGTGGDSTVIGNGLELTVELGGGLRIVVRRG